jgi:hypothetical protein
MIKERMIRNLPNLMMAVIIAVSVFLCVTALPEKGFSAWEIVNQPTDYPKSVDPYEVIVYEHANFVGKYMRFKLELGMRQKLVPVLPSEMNDVISSIQVGSKVAVMVFRDANFEDISKHRKVPGPASGQIGKFGEQLFPIYESKKVLDLNDEISSLIVFPKEMIQPIGVMLGDRASRDWGDKFFPLPERLDQTEAKYATLPNMNDDANVFGIYPNNPKSPAYGKVQMTLYEHPNFKGKWITLPGADGVMPSEPGCSPPYEFGGAHCMSSLGPYQFGDIASSLIVRLAGPVSTTIGGTPTTPQASTSVRVVAPEAPSTTRVVAPPAPDIKQPSSERTPLSPSVMTIRTNVSGQWKSSIGFVYNITQQGNQFKWTVVNSDQTGEGTITGNDISASWKDQKGAGSSSGKITAYDSSGKPTEIKWNNGVRFFR